MRTAAADATLVRRNLTLRGREAARLDYLRTRLEASSDSEVVRQALRYLEELVEDEAAGKGFLIVPKNGNAHEITIASLADDLDDDLPLVRRNMLVHQSSVDRLESMKSLAGIPSDSEAIRMALKYYNILVDEAGEGSQFYIVSGQNRMQVRIAGLAPPRRPTNNVVQASEQFRKVDRAGDPGNPRSPRLPNVLASPRQT
jgi:Arc/MetJ-type ribon-helix-helix transcriptional regulator